MKRITTIAAAAMLALAAGTISASADDCSGHDHSTGTVLGAGGAGIVLARPAWWPPEWCDDGGGK